MLGTNVLHLISESKWAKSPPYMKSTTPLPTKSDMAQYHTVKEKPQSKTNALKNLCI